MALSIAAGIAIRCAAIKIAEVNGSAMLVDGQRVWVTYRDDAIGSDGFKDLGAAYETETGAVIVGNVGGATARFMRQRPLVDWAVGWLERTQGKTATRTPPAPAD